MKIVSIVSASLLLMSAASFAQSEPMTPAKASAAIADANEAELNKTEKLTADKQKASAELYAKLDTNKDGKLSRAEFDAMPNRSKDFVTLDADNDGTLTEMEFSKHKL